MIAESIEKSSPAVINRRYNFSYHTDAEAET